MHVFRRWLGRMLVFMCLGGASYFFAAAMMWPLLRGEEFGFGAFALMVTMGIYLGAAYWTSALGRSMIFTGVIAALAVFTYQLPSFGVQGGSVDDLSPALRMGWGAMFAIASAGLIVPGLYILKKTPKADPYALDKLEREFPALKGYAAAFESDLGGWMKAEETKRQKATQNIQYFTLAVGFISGLLVMLLSMAGKGAYELAVVFPGTMAMVMCRQIAQTSFQREVRSHLREHVCKWMGFAYDKVVDKFDFKIFATMNLVPQFTSKKVMESYHGKREAVPFQIAECHLSRLGNGDGVSAPENNGDDSSVFRGMLIAIFVPYSFKGVTKVLPDLGVISNSVLRQGMQEPLVETNLGEHSAAFSVFGTDPGEAQAILTSDLMDVLVNLSETVAPGSKPAIAFTGNTVLISLNYMGAEGAYQQETLDMPVCDRTAVAQFVREVSLLQQLVDLTAVKAEEKKDVRYL